MKRRHVATRPQLLMRSQLDGRTSAARVFDRMIADIESDLGGEDTLSRIEKSLVEAYSGSYVLLSNLNTRVALGEVIDISQHSQCVLSMVRVGSRLGIQRRAKDISPTLSDFIRKRPT